MNISEKKLNEIYEGINIGKKYCGIRNSMGVGRIMIGGDDKYICYAHAGTSAIENTPEMLRFVLETIFDDCNDISEAEWSEYHVNYVPIDKKYLGIDMSSSHPNVYGL